MKATDECELRLYAACIRKLLHFKKFCCAFYIIWIIFIALLFPSESSHESFISFLFLLSFVNKIILSKDYFYVDYLIRKTENFRRLISWSMETTTTKKTFLSLDADIKLNICLMIFSKSVWVLKFDFMLKFKRGNCVTI